MLRETWPSTRIIAILPIRSRCAHCDSAGKQVKRRFRLTRSTDFQRVRRVGKSYAHPLVVFLLVANDLGHVRVGIAAGRAVGNAVERNTAKRRLRACLQPVLTCLEGGWDIVLLARKPISQAPYREICTAIHALLRRAGLLHDRTQPFG